MHSIERSEHGSTRCAAGQERRSAGGRHSISRQMGITTLGFIILVVFLGLFSFGALRLTPMYLNYMKVVGVINGVKTEFDGQQSSRTAIRISIARRFDIESISVIKAKDVKVTTVDGGMEVSVEYDHIAPFIGNISFAVHFDKTELVRR